MFAEATQVGPLDELHRQKKRGARLFFDLPEVKDLHDVGVLEPRRRAGLVAKHRHEVVVFKEVRQHPLDADPLLEASRGGASAENFRHAAHRQAGFEDVAAVGARECHGGHIARCAGAVFICLVRPG